MTFGSGAITFVNNPAKVTPATVVGMQNGLSLVGTNGELGANPLLHDTIIEQAAFAFKMQSLAKDIFVLDPLNNYFQLGFGSFGQVNANGLNLEIYDNIANGNENFILSDNNGSYLSIDIFNKLYGIGDLGFFSNGSQLIINDTSKYFVFSATSGKVLNFNIPQKTYQIGDIDSSNGGTYLSITDDLIAGNFDFWKNGQVMFNIAQGGITSPAPSLNGAGQWLLGKKLAAAVVLDAANYIEVSVDNVVYKLAIVN